LATTMRDATNSGLVPVQLEVRLARASIEFQSGNTASGRTTLSALRKEAEGKGFGLVSKKAAEVAGMPRNFRAFDIPGNLNLLGTWVDRDHKTGHVPTVNSQCPVTRLNRSQRHLGFPHG
jgi:hypothetical protein